ncbi:MAG TPA: hypothetical protein VFL95_08925 [Gemmatimonadales bacterium]|nr:hypothetical protein [Gemmatimonadales bacterium]
MTESEFDPERERLILAERISDWLDSIDLDDDAARTALATSVSGVLAAAADARRQLDEALRSNPLADAAEADRALELFTQLTVHLTGELRNALDDLERAWPTLEDRLIELGPDDEPPT